MTDGAVEQLKKFVFTSHSRASSENSSESLEIVIPELLQASYSFYTWPSASVLAWFLWERRHELPGKKVLELGAGTSLPGIVAAKSGARVILSDSVTLPKTLQHIRRCAEVNNLVVGQDIEIIGLTWGIFLRDCLNLGSLDLIIASDCFYEPSVFEDILVTIYFLLENNPSAKFLFTYQERSSDWSIEHLLTKWDLKCTVLNTSNLGADSGLSLNDLTGDHSIHLFEISKS